jgi:type I restriction enzyme S subunit
MEIKPGYKITEVGVIPEDWKYLSIAEVATLESGHTPSKKRPAYWGGDVQWISLHDTEVLAANVIHKTAKAITQEGLNNSSARLLPAGTVVFSRTATVGKVSIMASSMATSQDFANYICGPRLHNQYLMYLFRSMSRVWQSLMAGSIHNTIYMPVFKALKIVLPPLAEQRAIATALSDVDALIDGLTQLLAKKRNLKQAAMQQLLTGKTRLPGFGGEWVVRRLGEAIECLVAGVSVNSSDGELAVDEPCVLKTSAISQGQFIPGECKTIIRQDWMRARVSLESDTLLISRMNTPDLVGEIGYVDRDYPSLFLPDRIWMTRFHKQAHVSARWLAYLLSGREYGRRIKDSATGTSGSMKNISKDALLSIEVAFPEFEEQTAIAQVLSDMDAELAELEARLAKTRALKQGMMQELLTGRTRLVPPAKEKKSA